MKDKYLISGGMNIIQESNKMDPINRVILFKGIKECFCRHQYLIDEKVKVNEEKLFLMYQNI
jgi:hypothetical protein